jgi:L-serine dehydratase
MVSSSISSAQLLSVVDLFTIGVGPSSSHTVGPMRAAAAFAGVAVAEGVPISVTCELFGSLALTGKGHATDVAVLLGLSGLLPEVVDPNAIPALVEEIRQTGTLRLAGKLSVPFAEAERLVFRRGEFLPGHANAMRLVADYRDGHRIVRTYFSIGGGAIRVEGEENLALSNISLPLPFKSAAELLEIGRARGLSIADIVWANEEAWRSKVETTSFIDAVRAAMLDCIERGYSHGGILPGGLKVPRRESPPGLSACSRSPYRPLAYEADRCFRAI